MASGLYPEGIDSLHAGAFVLGTDTMAIALVATTYSYSAAHDFWDDVTASEVADGGASGIAGLTSTAGVVDGTDYTFSSVSGSDIGFIVTSEYNASDAARALWFKVDVTTTSPNGNDIDVVWDSGANKIYSISAAS